MPIFLNYINSLEGNHALFYAEQQALNVQNNVQNIKNSLNNYQLASIGLLIIVVVGNIGIITLFINRHKKAIAVSCAYGATLTGIAFETFAELLLVALAGMAVSFISLHFASPLLNDIYAGTQVEPRFVLVGLAIALVTAVIPTVAAVYSLKKISVTEILKTN